MNDDESKVIWRVRVEVDVCVVASDAQEAQRLAEAHAGAEAHCGSYDAARVSSYRELPGEWDINCRPYGTRDDWTIGDWLGVSDD